MSSINTSKHVIGVIGLGYVGLPLAAAFARTYKVIGFDINTKRLEELKKNTDRNLEVTGDGLKSPNLIFTSNLNELRAANFFIVTVPTPIDEANNPDLKAMFGASESVGKALKKGDIVVYESTVYPGVTEEECAPILEKFSGLKSGVDFKLGYSPERINPGDKDHSFDRIDKVVSGQDEESLNTIAEVYGSVIKAKIYKAQSIKVAEMAKVIENTQRDLNIALMNELSLICHRLEINTFDVLKAAETKWNFLRFYPGLVGGHCIGVDPYYLTHKAEKIGYIPQVILAGRRVNDGMAAYIAQQTVKQMILAGQNLKDSTVTVLGISFKENCPDSRNSKVADIVREISGYGIMVQIYDPLVYADEVKEEYGIELTKWDELKPANALILAVAHAKFRELNTQAIRGLITKDGVVIDVKNILDHSELTKQGIASWKL